MRGFQRGGFQRGGFQQLAVVPPPPPAPEDVIGLGHGKSERLKAERIQMQRRARFIREQNAAIILAASHAVASGIIQ